MRDLNIYLTIWGAADSEAPILFFIAIVAVLLVLKFLQPDEMIMPVIKKEIKSMVKAMYAEGENMMRAEDVIFYLQETKRFIESSSEAEKMNLHYKALTQAENTVREAYGDFNPAKRNSLKLYHLLYVLICIGEYRTNNCVVRTDIPSVCFRGWIYELYTFPALLELPVEKFEFRGLLKKQNSYMGHWGERYKRILFWTI